MAQIVLNLGHLPIEASADLFKYSMLHEVTFRNFSLLRGQLCAMKWNTIEMILEFNPFPFSFV